MVSSDFPTRLADLTLNDSSHNPSLYATLRSIRKSALSIPHRLDSILADAKFAKAVADQFKLPLVANERCGSWYIDPADKVGSAYFKSTDGHHGQWGFSLRRLNLQLLPILREYGGAVVVDSTRRGKNLPDSFSKTVPVWVAVINRTLFPERRSTHPLQCPPPPNDLGQSEISQIEARLNDFALSFLNLRLDIAALREELKRPVRIVWAANGCFDAVAVDERPSHHTEPLEEGCHQLVLCSASRRVRGAESSQGGYIQGAGDDSEGWSHGLTPQVFWECKDKLMTCPEEELPDTIERLLELQNNGSGSEAAVRRIAPTPNLHIGMGTNITVEAFDLVINCQGDGGGSLPKYINLQCRSGKLGSKDLRNKLASASHAVRQRLLKNRQSQILVTCASGKDLSAGVAVALLCLFYDDQGRLRESFSDGDAPVINKDLVKQRLAWISSSKPDANPSRATLQAVNSFMMQPPD